MDDSVRIDKWLWAVRIFKTRSDAAEACRTNRVTLNGSYTKPSREIKPGDTVTVRKTLVTYSFRVLALVSSRQGAKNVPEYMEDITPPEELNKLNVPRETIFVQRGMDGQDLFRSVSLALARAEMAQQENSTPQADAFKSYCVSYMLCRKYGVDTQGYDFSRLPDELKNAEPQTIRGELTDIRDTLQTMTGKMARTLEQSRTAAQKETGKER